MSRNQSRSSPSNFSKTEIHSSELTSPTSPKVNSGSRNNSFTASPKCTFSSRSPKKTSRLAWKEEEDPRTSEIKYSSQIASEKARNILNSPYISKKGTKNNGTHFFNSDNNLNSGHSVRISREKDSSQISGYYNHVSRLRSYPENENAPIQSPKQILISRQPNLTPTKRERDELISEIDEVLARLENE
ncbi:hypothetical protein TRFO_27187 [Tritrichomonas foetus]|uniref:Uncharacterized protein n=1 Tax=Tritrichomonas foetus TaxID=1144522 RepID=A0A1J4K1B7_9EUKA|nr:hypothetical protein TRFO_27187 [Tritrichomonas foetus]|eukprot:OHT05175.1 hypothetical protein TRFO_27187 [Tritrichomonas foetus]